MDGSQDRIVPLDQLDDYRVADGDPDVRGWDVLSSDGRKVGEVEELLVDRSALKVRYLDVQVDKDLLEGDSRRHILIPIGYARLDQDDDRIFVDTLDSTTLRQIPEYRREPLTREYEMSLRNHFDRDVTPTASTGMTGGDVGTDSDFYTGDMYSDDRFYGARRGQTGETERVTRSEEELRLGKREHQAGEVTVDRHVETEHVRESVPLRHEEVVVERRPVDGDYAATGRIGDAEEIRIPVNEEELVVEKRVVPKEEIVVRKQEHVETEVVEADLRKERIDVRGDGDVDVRGAD
jgi:uncharacterized protein (TIGR02271 family)